MSDWAKKFNTFAWTCKVCLVGNKEEAKKCISCESVRPGFEEEVAAAASGGAAATAAKFLGLSSAPAAAVAVPISSDKPLTNTTFQFGVAPAASAPAANGSDGAAKPAVPLQFGTSTAPSSAPVPMQFGTPSAAPPPLKFGTGGDSAGKPASKLPKKTEDPDSRKKAVSRSGLKGETGLVATWGSGDCGQLGNGEDLIEGPKPRSVGGLEDNLVYLSCGGLHNAVVTKDGKVITWGCNDDKVLGRTGNEYKPEPVVGMPDDAKVIKVSCGDCHMAALTETGKVYTWGTYRDSEGYIGHTNTQLRQIVPTMIEGLPPKKKVVDIASGSHHTVCVLEDGKLYSWGCSQQGQLGRKHLDRWRSSNLVARPIGLPSLGKRKAGASGSSQSNVIEKVFCGAYHTFALSKSGDVYAWGLNNFGQLGSAEIEDGQLDTPVHLPNWKDYNIETITAGQHHTMFLTKDGDVYSVGRGDSGEMGQGVTVPQEKNPKQIHFGQKIVQIASGSHHNHALAESGDLYSWGYGEMYQLGNEKENIELSPVLVEASTMKKVRVLMIDSGGQHSAILCQRLPAK